MLELLTWREIENLYEVPKEEYCESGCHVDPGEYGLTNRQMWELGKAHVPGFAKHVLLLKTDLKTKSREGERRLLTLLRALETHSIELNSL